MNDIVSNFNNLLNTIYNSIENEGYVLLEKISDINNNIFLMSPLKAILAEQNVKFIDLIINTIAFGFVVFYFMKIVLLLYSDNLIENIYYFILKVIIVVLISKNSYSICKYIIDINFKYTVIVEDLLEEISGKHISYESLKKEILTLQDVFDSKNKLSLNGISESIIYFFILNMILIFSMRYVLVIICVILSPFFILMILNKETRKIFKLWVKIFLSSLLIQIINKIIIFIPLTMDKKDELFTTVLIGTILLLYSVNKVWGRMEKIWKE